VCFVFGCGPDVARSIFVNNLALLSLDRVVGRAVTGGCGTDRVLDVNVVTLHFGLQTWPAGGL
jgi:hypothetical protein